MLIFSPISWLKTAKKKAVFIPDKSLNFVKEVPLEVHNLKKKQYRS